MESSACRNDLAQSASGPVPRGQRRREQIVAIAEQVFLASGFTETTMQMVATRAGASKETLYRHFGSKEDLFAEVVGNRARFLRRRLEANLERPVPMGDVLRDLGTNLLGAMTSPETVSLLRIVVSETSRDPTLGQIFYDVGPGQTQTKLARFLAKAKDRGEFTGRNPSLAASIFLGAVMSQAHLTCLVLGAPAPMSQLDIEERVEEVVAVFLKSYSS